MLSRIKIAKRIVEAMNMKSGETLRVSGGAAAQDLVEEVAIQAMKKGIDVSISTSRNIFIKRLYDEIPIKYIRRTSKIALKLAEVVDNSIRIDCDDPKIYEKISHNKISASHESGLPISKIMDRRNVKWCLVGYPTQELADYLEVDFSKLKRFILDAILVDRRILMKNANVIKSALQKADYVHITDDYGTDLKLRLVGRKIMASDGYISDQDKKEKDIGLNLPDGEVFTTPLETYAEGVLISPKRADIFTEKMIEKNEKIMKNTLKKSLALDKKKFPVVRTTNPAELGIGLNPIINEVIGYLLTDEKIFGTIHVAIGKNCNKAYGGKSNSSIHWDFVTNKGVNIEIIRKNKGFMLMEKGKLVI
jgi:aminopeptidase